MLKTKGNKSMSGDLFCVRFVSSLSLVQIHSNEANTVPFPHFVAIIKILEHCNVYRFPVVLVLQYSA